MANCVNDECLSGRKFDVKIIVQLLSKRVSSRVNRCSSINGHRYPMPLLREVSEGGRGVVGWWGTGPEGVDALWNPSGEIRHVHQGKSATSGVGGCT